jgi:hypothetical protein
MVVLPTKFINPSRAEAPMGNSGEPVFWVNAAPAQLYTTKKNDLSKVKITVSRTVRNDCHMRFG